MNAHLGSANESGRSDSGAAVELCIYCGQRGADTVDHVPPRCLFQQPRPSNLYTVPCCRPCNERFALDDEYFRTAMVFRWDVADHPAAKTIVAKALRSTGRSPGFRDLFTRSLEAVPIITHGGIYVEQGGRFQPDGRRLDLVLERIVRGLHYKKTGTALSPATSVGVFADEMLQQADPGMRTELLKLWAPITQGEPEIFGNETFLFFHRIEGAGARSAWLMLFFSRVIYFGIAGHNEGRHVTATTAS